MKFSGQLLIATALLLSSVGYSQTITFDDQGHFNEQSLPNPYTITNGSETFSFSLSNGGNPHQYSSADAFCGNSLAGHLRAGTVAATSWTIATTSGNEINLGTIRFDNIFTCFAFSYSLTIEGFKNGSSTGTQALTVSGSNVTFNSNSSFDDVDQIVITSADLGYLGIDNINWAPVGLPVELISFSGVLNDAQKAELNWSTATEYNNEGFKIMHSLDGELWNQIGFVEGVGTTTSQKDYQFEFLLREPQMHYFQLIQTDFDGTEAKSNIVAVDGMSRSEEFKIVPNPTNSNSAYLVANSPIESVLVKDEMGRNVDYFFDSNAQIIAIPHEYQGVFSITAKLASGQIISARLIVL